MAAFLKFAYNAYMKSSTYLELVLLGIILLGGAVSLGLGLTRFQKTKTLRWRPFALLMLSFLLLIAAFYYYQYIWLNS